LGEGCHYAASEFNNFKFNFWIITQGFANADEAAAIFFDVACEVKTFGYEFVAQAGAVVVFLNVGHTDAAVKDAGAEDRDLVVEDINLDV
jgi:hypothetical protein